MRPTGNPTAPWPVLVGGIDLKLAELPIFDDHRDPFDRLLVAQSLAEPLILLTIDSKLARYGSTIRAL